MSGSYLSSLRKQSGVIRKVFQYPPNVINWYPGHMQKCLRQLSDDYLPNTSIVLEVRDARIPVSCQHQCEQFLDAIEGKPKLVIFNKSDLLSHSERDRLQEWCYHKSENSVNINNKDKYCIGYNYNTSSNSISINNKKQQHNKSKPKKELPNKTFAGQIMQKLNEIKDEQSITAGQLKLKKRLQIPNNSIIVSVMGYPNVGKSTIINSLRHLYHKKDTAVTGKLAGVTRHVSYFALQSSSSSSQYNDSAEEQSAMYLLDTPGIFVPGKTADAQDMNQLMKLAICGCVADHAIGLREISDFILFTLNNKSQFSYMKYCNLDDICDDIDVVLDSLARYQQHHKANKQNKQYLKTVFDPTQNRELDQYNEQITCNMFIDLFRSGKLDQTILDDLDNINN